MSSGTVEPPFQGRLSNRADLPFYNGQPFAFGGGGWVFLMLSVALAFVILIAIPAQTFAAMLLQAFVFAGLPLLALHQLAGRHWTALFGPVGLKQVGQMLLFACLTIAASLVAGLTVQALGSVAPNPAATAMNGMTGPDFILRLITTLPQLVGEELMTVLPFLALLWLANTRLGIRRTAAIVIALVATSILFGAAHLPTYDWHWAQCFGVIGTARMVLTLAYVCTRNLWISAGAHILNDWFELAFAFAVSHVPIRTI